MRSLTDDVTRSTARAISACGMKQSSCSSDAIFLSVSSMRLPGARLAATLIRLPRGNPARLDRRAPDIAAYFRAVVAKDGGALRSRHDPPPRDPVRPRRHDHLGLWPPRGRLGKSDERLRKPHRAARAAARG